MSDWEDFADENIDIGDKNSNKVKFENEQVVDHDKEEREQKEREEQKRKAQQEMEAQKKENEKDKKDYEKVYNERIGATDKKDTVLTKEQLMKENPNMTEAQINDLLSRQSEQALGNNLFEEEKDDGNLKLTFKFKELKGEKIYKKCGEEIANFINKRGESNNHIPKLFSEMFNVLGEKITIQKMRNIISDFDEKLKKKKDEMDQKIAEEKKLEKKPKVNKKTNCSRS